MKTKGKFTLVLGERQQMIMQCVWDAGGSVTIQDIIDRMVQKCGIRFSKSSINTLVVMLVNRGFLVQDKKIHQAFTFKALISEEDFRIQEIKRINEFTFNNSPTAMFASIMKSGITNEQIEQMKAMIDSYENSQE